MASDLSKYTMAGVLGIAEFARGKDKKPRKRRRMIAGGAALAAGLGAAGRYGMAGAREMRATQGGLRAGLRGANRAGQGDLWRVGALGAGAKSRAGAAVGRVRAAAGRTAIAANAGALGARSGLGKNPGRLRMAAAGAMGGAKGALSTKGGKLGAGLAAAGLVGGGVAAGLRRRRKNRRG